MGKEDGKYENGKQANDGLPREILDAFDGNIRPVRVPISYRFGILLVAILMVILPLIYIGIIFLVGFGVYYHAVHHTEVLQMGRGRGRMMAGLLYVAPMVVGGIMILFMFKPLLSRPAKRTRREPVSSDEEPLLFAFVGRICEAVRAPRPRQIELDEEVNASASFRKGFLSMLGNDLVSTVGLPLVAGLNMRQFAGVLAHEFGHFSQGAGMRLTYVIRSISHWFTRVVYERDQWDERLVQWSQESDLRFGWILYLARVFVWITRRILWVLMVIGQSVSGFMLRQMEFDADRHEARLAGSDVFESTSKRIVSLNVASQAAHSDLGDFYREGRLCDDFPKLVVHNHNQFTPEVLSNIDQMSTESETGWLDTHPCESDRIASAKKEQAPGVFRLEMPASRLFADFEARCRHVTWDFYRDIFGDQLAPSHVHPVEELLQRKEQEQIAFQGLHRCLQGTFRGDRPLRLASWQVPPPGDTGATVERVKRAPRGNAAGCVPVQAKLPRYDEAQESERQPLVAEMATFETLVGRRIGEALQLLHSPHIAGRIEHASHFRQRIEKLLPALRHLNDQVDAVKGVGTGNAQLAGLFEQLSEDDSNESLIGLLRTQMQQNDQLILDVRRQLDACDYPYDHAKGTISLGEFALAELPSGDNPGEIYQAAEGLVKATVRLRARLTGDLCLIVEQVESALGLKPLPEPVQEDQEAS